MKVATTFRFTLKQVRELLSLSQQELADKAGVSIGTIIAIECNGKYKTHTLTAVAIARSVGLTIEDIVWPRGLSDHGRPPMTGVPLDPTYWRQEFCPKCGIEYPLKHDECENCS